MKSIRGSVRGQFTRAAAKASDALAGPVIERLDDRWSPSVKVGQIAIAGRWRADAANGVRHDLRDTGFRVFSQFEEDGLLLYIFSVIGTRSKRFVDIGAADGINSNCANLAVNHGWDGVFIEGDPNRVAIGRSFYESHPDTWAWPPRFVQGIVRRDTVNQLIKSAGVAGEVDLLSIDIDGNDYWVWDALDVVSPRVVIIETHVEFGLETSSFPTTRITCTPAVIPTTTVLRSLRWPPSRPPKGYRLVGANSYGFNTIWLRSGEGEDLLPAVEPAMILDRHPRNAERLARLDALRSWPYVRGGTGFPGDPV